MTDADARRHIYLTVQVPQKGRGDMAIVNGKHGDHSFDGEAPAAHSESMSAPASDSGGEGIANGEELAWTERFDAIFSNAALHWMLRAEEVAHGMARALRPGGRLVAEFGGDQCVATVLSAAAQVLRARGEDPSRWLRWYFPKPGQYASLLERHGFRVASLQLFARPTPMPGEDGLARWLRLFAGPLMTFLGSSAGAFEEEVAQHCRGALFRDGVWTLDYVRLRVRATRS